MASKRTEKSASVHLPPIDFHSKIGSKALPNVALKKSPATSLQGSLSSLSDGNKSAALGFEIRLREVFEQYPKSPTPARVFISFQIFDEILQLLHTQGSIYEPVLREIKAELYESVYSKDLTSADLQPGLLDRIPFFIHVDRMALFRQSDLKTLNDSIGDREQKIKLRERDMNMLMKKNLMLKQTISKMEATVSQDKQSLAEMEQSIRTKETEAAAEKEKLSAELQLTNDKVDLLQKNLDAANSMVEKLSNFKTKDSEHSHSGDAQIDPEMAKKHIALNAQTFAKMNMAEASTLEEQLKDILVAQLEDFEQALTQLKKKKEILIDSTSGATRHANQMKFNAEVSEITSSFKKRIESFREEQKFLDDQKLKIKETIKRFRVQRQGHNLKRLADTPYRRYALSLFYSTNHGKTFHQFAEVPKCPKCGDKTIICSHQVSNSITVALKNPKNSIRNQPWTHIRLQNPLLKLAVTSGQIKLFQQKSYHEASILTDDDADDDQSEDELDIVTEDMNLKLPKSIRMVWRNYYRVRKGVKPRVQRILTLEKLLWTIKEIYDIRLRLEDIFLEGKERTNLRKATAGKTIILVDDGYGDITYVEEKEWERLKEEAAHDAEGKPEADRRPKVKQQYPLTGVVDASDLEFLKDLKGLRFSERFCDFFYHFLEFRYHFKDVAMIVAHDILTSCQILASENRAVSMFVQHLSGEDDVAWKYVCLAKDIFCRHDKLTLENMRLSLMMLYPYRYQKEFYDQMELEEIAFSKNRITQETCIEHMRHGILNRMEPNYRSFLRNLRKYDKEDHGYFTKEEFIEAMSTIYPPAPTSIKAVRYEVANLHFPKNRVPLERLAIIGCYCIAWCNRAWESFSTVPPLEYPGDNYLLAGNPQEAAKQIAGERGLMEQIQGIGRDAIFVPGNRRFTSLENLIEDAMAERPAETKQRRHSSVGGKRIRRPSISATLLRNRTDEHILLGKTTEELELEAATDMNGPAARELEFRRRSVITPVDDDGRITGKQMAIDAAAAAANEAKILETMKTMVEEDGRLAKDMHAAHMDLNDLPKVAVLADGEEMVKKEDE